MLSYQHAFHAGNHADVLKHLSLLALLEKLQIKPKPFFFLDTHAGNGCYGLSHANVNSSQHADEVLAGKLSAKKADGNALIKRYKEIVSPYLNKQMYPGSPLIANELARSSDSLHVNELHPQAFNELSAWAKGSQLQVHNRDGFELLNALTPPKPNRGLVLIDPPYEQAGEYQQVLSAIQQTIAKWPQGIIALWYPLLSPTRINRNTKQVEANPKSGLSESMLSDLALIATQGLLTINFAVQSPNENVGMYGSGLAIINPPWQLEASLQHILAALTSQLKIDDNALSSVDILVPSP